MPVRRCSLSVPTVYFAVGAALVGLVTGIAACGDDDDDPSSSPSATAATSSTPTAAASLPAGGSDVPPGAIDIGTVAPLVVAYGAGQGDFPSDQPGLAVADLNGDGFDDFVAGARFADGPGGQDSGAAYVVFGGESLPATADFGAGEADLTVYGHGRRREPRLRRGRGRPRRRRPGGPRAGCAVHGR